MYRMNSKTAVASFFCLQQGSDGRFQFLFRNHAHLNMTNNAIPVNDDDNAEAADTADTDNMEEEVQCGPQDGNEADEISGSEVENGAEDAAADTGDETAPAGLTVTAVQSQSIAEEANPGTATLAVEFDRENGKDIWEVELDNGRDVKVDAGSGQILLTEARD